MILKYLQGRSILGEHRQTFPPGSRKNSKKTSLHNILIALCILVWTPGVYSQVNVEAMRNSQRTDGLHGMLEMNLRINSGNIEIFDIGSGLRLEYNKRNHAIMLVTNAQYATEKSARFINRGFAHIRYNLNLRNNFIWELFTQNEFNEFTRLFSRALAGTGARFVLLENEKEGIYFGTSYMVEREHLDIASGSSEKSKIWSNRWSNYLVFKFSWEGGASLVNTIYSQSNMSAFDDVRFLNDLTVITELTGRLRLTVTAHIKYDSRPPHGVKKTDIEFRNGLMYTF